MHGNLAPFRLNDCTLRPFSTMRLIWEDSDWTETKQPQCWASKLVRAFPLQACTRVKIEHTELPSSREKSVCSDRCWSEERTPPVIMEVARTLMLLSRSISEPAAVLKTASVMLEKASFSVVSHAESRSGKGPLQRPTMVDCYIF